MSWIRVSRIHLVSLWDGPPRDVLSWNTTLRVEWSVGLMAVYLEEQMSILAVTRMALFYFFSPVPAYHEY